MDQSDPFGLHRTEHPALAKSHDLPCDIYHPLFDDFFQTEVFNRWVGQKTSWQLYCTGGPGSGKTTLAALTAKRLREKCKNTETHVAPIFIKGDVLTNELAFLEDFLLTTYNELTPLTAFVDQETAESYELYEIAQTEGKRASKRINLIQDALHARVADCARSFLILDGIDHCSSSLQELLERQLANLQLKGLSVMVTSRLPIFEKPEGVWCDFHPSPPLRLYWECTNCQDRWMCFDCKGEGKVCDKCEVDTFLVEYKPEYLDLSIDKISEPAMREFVAWDLEREHGDLGLESQNDHKPPLSSLGASFTSNKVRSADVFQKMVDGAHGNIAIAKLNLDLVHGASSLDSAEFIPSRLARNVQTLYDEGVKKIGQQADGQRLLALKAIAAVAKEGTVHRGVSLNRLAHLIQERPHFHEDTSMPPRSTEDILHAALGYLSLTFDEYEYYVAIFNPTFFYYVFDDYNDELVYAKTQLRTTNIPRAQTAKLIARRSTRQQSRKPTETMKPKQAIFDDLRRFMTESPPLMFSPKVLTPKSPPEEDRPILSRSDTGMLPGMKRARSKPLGLGLGSIMD